MKITGSDCCDCCGLSAETALPQMDRQEAVLERKFRLLRREVPFRSDQDGDFGTALKVKGSQCFLDGYPLPFSLEAVADQLQTLAVGQDEIFHRHRLSNQRKPGLERLLHGGQGYLAGPFGLEDLSLAPFTDYRNYLVHTEFHSLFDEPLETVVVLRGTDGHCQ